MRIIVSDYKRIVCTCEDSQIEEVLKALNDGDRAFAMEFNRRQTNPEYKIQMQSTYSVVPTFEEYIDEWLVKKEG